jgi:hypothetical protein
MHFLKSVLEHCKLTIITLAFSDLNGPKLKSASRYVSTARESICLTKPGKRGISGHKASKSGFPETKCQSFLREQSFGDTKDYFKVFLCIIVMDNVITFLILCL